MTEPGDLPLLIAQEITEDCVEEGMPLEDIAEYKAFKIPKGIGRISLVMMARRINKEGENAPEPKKTLNRITYRLLKIAADHPDPEIAMKAATLVFDRLDGKAAQALHIGDADGEKLAVNIVRFSDLPLVGESTTVGNHPPKRLDS